MGRLNLNGHRWISILASGLARALSLVLALFFALFFFPLALSASPAGPTASRRAFFLALLSSLRAEANEQETADENERLHAEIRSLSLQVVSSHTVLESGHPELWPYPPQADSHGIETCPSGSLLSLATTRSLPNLPFLPLSLL